MGFLLAMWIFLQWIAYDDDIYQLLFQQCSGLPEIEEFAYSGANELTQCSKYFFAKVSFFH